MRDPRFILLILLALNCNAQDRPREVLRKELSEETNDSNRVKLFEKLAYSTVNSMPDSALIFAREGYALATKVGFKRGEANCLNLIGTTFLKTGNYPKALEFRLQTLKIYEELNSVPDLIIINSNIGNILSEIGNGNEALDYYYKALALCRKSNKPAYEHMVLCNIGDAYEKLDVLDSARVYTHKAFEFVEQKDTLGRGIILCNLGNIHRKMKQDDLALGYYRLSMPDLEYTNNHEGICEVTMGMAEIFQAIGQTDSALYYAKLCFSTANRAGFTRHVLNAGNLLSDLYKGKEDINSAYFYLQASLSAKDSLFSQEKNHRLQSLIYTELMRQQELAQAKIEAEKERRDHLQLSAIAAFIPGFFAVVLFLRKKKTNPRVLELLGLLGLLFLFEFITLFIHPSIEELTHHTPVFMLLILVAVAALLVPLHHKMAEWVKEKLARAHPVPVEPQEVPVASSLVENAKAEGE